MPPSWTSGLVTIAVLILSMFSGSRVPPGGFFFIMFPVVQNFSTNLIMLVRLGNIPWAPALKRVRNARWVANVLSPFLTHASYVNTRYSTDHCSIATEIPKSPFLGRWMTAPPLWYDTPRLSTILYKMSGFSWLPCIIGNISDITLSPLYWQCINLFI